MTTTTPFLITVIGAIATYLSATVYLIHRFRGGHQTNPIALFAFLLVGLALHGAATYQTIDPNNALSLDILSVGTLIFWVINVLVLLSGLNKPLHNLYIFPVSVICSRVVRDTANAATTQPGSSGHTAYRSYSPVSRRL